MLGPTPIASLTRSQAMVLPGSPSSPRSVAEEAGLTVRAERLGRTIVCCSLSGIALCGALWAATSAPVPRRDKGAKSQAAQPGRWSWRDHQLAVSPDGKWLAACLLQHVGRRGTWGALWLLNLASGEARLIRPGLLWEGGAACVAFSPESSLLALCEAAHLPPLPVPAPRFKGADYAAEVRDVSTGNQVPGFMRRGWVNWIGFAPDGKTLAAAKDFGAFPPFPPPWGDLGNLLHLWDRQTGQALKLSTSFHGFIGGLAFSPDSTQLAVANNKHVSLLDVRERQEVHRFECHTFCYEPSFSPDGKFIATRDRHKLIHVWDVDTGQEHPLQQSHAQGAWFATFSPVGRTLAAVGDDNTMRFWEVPSGWEIRSLSFPQGAPYPFLFTPDGQAVVGGGAEAGPVVHMWDANTGKELQRWDLTPVLNGAVPQRTASR